jgi:hypothetical protein
LPATRTSPGSNVATITLAPTSPSATASVGQIALTWNPPVTVPEDGVTYNVYRGTSAGGEGVVPVATALPSPTYADYEVSDGTTYYYQVTAVDSGGESAHSGEAFATATDVVMGTAKPDDFYVRLDPTHRFVQIFAASSPGGTPLYTLPYATLSSLTFDTLAGNDRLFVDLGNGSPIPSGTIHFDAGSGANDELALIGSIGDDTATFLASSVTANGGSITHANVEQDSYDGAGGWDNVTVSGGPLVTFPSTQHFQSLAMDDSTTASFAPAGELDPRAARALGRVGRNAGLERQRPPARLHRRIATDDDPVAD